MWNRWMVYANGERTRLYIWIHICIYREESAKRSRTEISRGHTCQATGEVSLSLQHMEWCVIYNPRSRIAALRSLRVVNLASMCTETLLLEDDLHMVPIGALAHGNKFPHQRRKAFKS